MNTRNSILSVLFASAAVCAPPAAHASLTMRTRLQNIFQIGDGSAAVSLGHAVDARTNMNRLVAGGTFNASCVSPYTGSIPGERSLTSALLLEVNRLYVTIPEWLPAVRNMPGFENVPGGSILSCWYAWTSRAQESTYNVGATGIGFTIGGEEIRDGSSVPFEMFKSGSGEEPNRGCIR